MKNIDFRIPTTGCLIHLALLPLFFLSGMANAQPYWKRISPKAWHEKMNILQVHSSKRGVALGANDHNLVTQTGTTWQNTVVAHGAPINPLFVEFSADTVVWAGYSNETLRKSTDGGRTWTNTGTGADIIELKFLDSQTGFGRKKNGNTYRLVKTTDGGATWPEVAGPNLPATYSNLSVLGTNEVWAKSGLYVVKTTDSGASWDSLTVVAGSALLGAKMVTAQFGYVFEAGWLHFTTNGGITWDTVSAPVALVKVQFINRLTGWCAGSSSFFKTTDGGVTWTAVNTSPHGTPRSFCFINASEGWAVANLGVIQSTDGGATWKSNVKVTGNALASVDFQANGRCWVVGYNNEILYTDNHGRSWTKAPFDSAESYLYVKFFSPLVGVVVGSKNTYRTHNGGASWEKSAILSGNYIWDVQFRNETFGYYFTANDRKIFTTSDLGQTWVEKTTPPLQFNDVMYSVYFVDAQYGYVLLTWNDNSPGPPPFDPSNEHAYKTIDGGASWTKLTSFPTGFFGAKLVFSSRNIGFAYVAETMALRTTDGGNTFAPFQFSTKNSSIQKFVFRTDSLGYILSDKGRLLKTTNGGLQWNLDQSVLAPTDSTAAFRDLGFINNEPVVAVGSQGLIYGSPDWYKLLTSASGKIVKKENNDCIQDVNEMPLQNRVVLAQPGGYYASTGADGNYTVEADSGSNTITQIPLTAFNALAEKQFCPPSNAPIPVTILGVEDSLEGNNFINEVKLCALLVLSQNQSRLRPCQKSSLTVSIQNQGNVASDSEWVHVKFPPQITPLSASSIYDFNAVDSTYRFKIKPLQPFETIAIHFVDSVACTPSQLLGQTLCIKAIIPNAPICLLQSPGWDGADLEVASRCVNNQTKFSLHNKGASMPSTSQYRIFIDSLLVYQAPFQLAGNSQMTVTLPPNTPGFIRLVVPQSANHPLSTFASAEANCAAGLSTNGMFPQPDESPLVDIECVAVRNAYDPNDKTVYPFGIGPDGKVEPETQFKYTIRFQNTGTDTAFKVVLVDTLDAGLDISTLQVMSASHPFDFKVSGKGQPVLSWTFNNILLPDSGANQLASNGYASFSIRPKTGLPLGTRLENFADIYFDFNDPVRTNTTVNTLWRPTLVDGILDTVFVTASKRSVAATGLSIYPNPTKGKLDVNATEAGQMNLYNIRGELILKTEVEKGVNPLNLSSLPKGLYLARFQFDGQQEVRKVVLE